MTVALVFSELFNSVAVTPSTPPTPGNLLVIAAATRNSGSGPTAITGWTVVPPGVETAQNQGGGSFRDAVMFYRVAQSGDTSWAATTGATQFFYSEWSGVAAFDTSAGNVTGVTSSVVCGGAVTTAGAALIIGMSVCPVGDTQTISTVPTSPAVEVLDTQNPGGSPGFWVAYRVEAAAGTYTVAGTSTIPAGFGQPHAGITAAFSQGSVIHADFEAATAEAGAATVFTDLSTGTPTSWAWDFGDGGTSTSQDPTHVYATAGTYTVTLTTTYATGSDSETHTVSIVAAGTPDPVEPAGVLLEIYAADPGSARWDVAKWDEDSWGSAGWQDVTPYGVTVDIDWGSSRPELGILSVPDAASWAVDYYDPDRVLDPANPDGPYFGDLLPFLPIRVSHRSLVIRQGFATGIAHYYAQGERTGYMRGADSITILANAMVPTDTALSDTLYARAVDAIAAAGLSVSVAAPLGTDPPVTPWVTDTREWSAWDWIKDAAQEVLHVPIIGNTGTVNFRPWAAPLARGRSIGSPELIDLQSVVDYSGNYSVVQAREDETTVIERRITPSPRYGARTYTRDEATLDPGAWADAVLADRGLPSLLWKPGEMRPLTAVSTEMLATIEAVELVSLDYPEEGIFASGIVVGGSIHIEGKRDDAAIWRFQYELAQTATEPLIETGGEATDYLLRTGGGEYLYPTGSA